MPVCCFDHFTLEGAFLDNPPLTFLASIAPLQSAITIASDGGARVKIDIPEDEMPAIMRLAMMRGRVLKITVEPEDDE